MLSQFFFYSCISLRIWTTTVIFNTSMPGHVRVLCMCFLDVCMAVVSFQTVSGGEMAI